MLTNFVVATINTNVVMSDVIGTNQHRFYQVRNLTITFQPPKIIGTGHSGGMFNLIFRGEAGRIYRVEYVNSLNAGTWAALTNLAVAAITNAVTFLTPPDASQLDYRVNQLTVPVFPPELEGVTLSGELANVYFTALPGLTYVMEYRDDLNAGSWFGIATVGPLSNSVAVDDSGLVCAQPHRVF